jgi:PIN domain nuclease of toxin-antitoxin system
MSQNEVLAPEALMALAECKAEEVPVFISAVTAWELGMLLSKGRIRETRDAERWYGDFLKDGGFTEHPVTSTIFVAACFLPQPIHKDPIDRILIATAREYDLTIITRDRAILSYGVAGHVRTLDC